MDYLYRWVALCTKAVEIAFYNHLKALFLFCPAIGNAYLSFISISLLSGFSIRFYIVGSLLPILHLVKSWRILVLNCCFAFWDEFDCPHCFPQSELQFHHFVFWKNIGLNFLLMCYFWGSKRHNKNLKVVRTASSCVIYNIHICVYLHTWITLKVLKTYKKSITKHKNKEGTSTTTPSLNQNLIIPTAQRHPLKTKNQF